MKGKKNKTPLSFTMTQYVNRHMHKTKTVKLRRVIACGRAAKPKAGVTQQFTLVWRFCMDFSNVLGGALWWLQRIATARLARLYDRILAGMLSSAEDQLTIQNSEGRVLKLVMLKVTVLLCYNDPILQTFLN